LKRADLPPTHDLPVLDAVVGIAGLPPATCLSTTAALINASARPVRIDVSSGHVPPEVDVLLIGAEQPEETVRALARKAPALIVLRPEDRGAIARFKAMGCAGWLVRPLRASSLIERIYVVKTGGLPVDEPEKLTGAGRVLIADDNPVNAMIARRALESAGFTVTVASTGIEALEAAKSMNPALVLMDLRMPEMDGFEAMRQLRAGGSDVPVIAVSAEVNADIERQARTAGPMMWWPSRSSLRPFGPSRSDGLALPERPALHDGNDCERRAGRAQAAARAEGVEGPERPAHGRDADARLRRWPALWRSAWYAERLADTGRHQAVHDRYLVDHHARLFL
jgi:CheY-like chemotaxis protein